MTVNNVTNINNYAAQGRVEQNSAGDGSFSFKDLFDIVNPLQHIPVVSTIYREATGDTISGVSRIIGGALFGGVAGLAASVANEVINQETGKDIGGNIISAMQGGKPNGDEVLARAGSDMLHGDEIPEPAAPPRIRATTKEWLSVDFKA